MPELLLQWGDLGYTEAIVPLGPVPSAEAKTVDFLQYMTVGALCDPTADVPFAALSDMTRCLGPVFTAAARVDPRGSVVVGAASLASPPPATSLRERATAIPLCSLGMCLAC